jgi:NADH dehydrogenase [ubiquinone] 1 alpha subcomplex assembly factor 1
MKYLCMILLLSLPAQADTTKIYSFTPQTKIQEWRVVNDGVMGGVSRSALVLTNKGHGHFYGHVSLANNGGFASVQLNTNIKRAKDQQFVVLRVKGDGKRYEFRMKGALSQRESYVYPFATSGEWETIKLAIGDFYPQFRGQKLNLPNFNFDTIAQMSFLIANKQEEDFELLVDWIGLE